MSEKRTKTLHDTLVHRILPRLKFCILEISQLLLNIPEIPPLVNIVSQARALLSVHSYDSGSNPVFGRKYNGIRNNDVYSRHVPNPLYRAWSKTQILCDSISLSRTALFMFSNNSIDMIKKRRERLPSSCPPEDYSPGLQSKKNTKFSSSYSISISICY